MITRLIFTEAKTALTQFRALCITGPRQSGKTTLSKQLFANKPYVNFENPSVQHEAEQNPEAFLQNTCMGPYSMKYSVCRIFSGICRKS